MESFKQGKVVGMKLNNLNQVAMNAIVHYREYWLIIEKSIKHFDRWEYILSNDKSGKFKQKHIDFRQHPTNCVS